MKNRGMTLFIAVVIMGILLFISFAVVNITIKGSLFASSGRDSQYAFYAADSGIECAIYWDSKPVTGSAFATSTASTITCAGLSVQTNDAIYGTSTRARIGGGGSANPSSTFGMKFNLTGNNPVNSCAIVTVDKYYTGPNLMTHIKSRGYNTCDISNPRRIERGVEVTY
jgi:Tfp pilus assembly protein PilX